MKCGKERGIYDGKRLKRMVQQSNGVFCHSFRHTGATLRVKYRSLLFVLLRV